MRPKPTRLMDHREYPVLYVDDERDNLRVFQLTFRRDFTLLTAESAKAGLELLAQHPVAVVLSDQKMPGIEGVEFLRQVRELEPRAIRMLVTAYGDARILGDAINAGNIYRYIPKPWEPEDMRLTIQRAIEAYALEAERATLLEELMILNRLSRTIHREIDRGRLYDTLLTALRDELAFDGCSVLLFDENSTRLRFVAHEPDDDVAARLRDLVFDPASAPAFVDRLNKGDSQLLHGDDASELESPVRAWMTEVAAEELYVVPLVGKERVVGALAVDNRRGGQRLASRRAHAGRRPRDPGRDRDREREARRRSAPLAGPGSPGRSARHTRDAGRGPRPRDQQSPDLAQYLHDARAGEAHERRPELLGRIPRAGLR